MIGQDIIEKFNFGYCRYLLTNTCLNCSYLVCSMFEEAASLSSSILKRLRDDASGVVTQDMLESAAMVLLQSFNQLGR